MAISAAPETDFEAVRQALGRAIPGRAINPVRIAGIDPRGLDLGLGPRLRRLPFPEAFESLEAINGFLQQFPAAESST